MAINEVIKLTCSDIAIKKITIAISSRYVMKDGR